MSEVAIAEAPRLEVTRKPAQQPPEPTPQPASNSQPAKSDITVLQVGGRLQITADVDKAGIAKLKDVLAKYEEILGLLG